MNLHKSHGYLKYSIDENNKYKLIVEVDPEIHRLSRSLIPKSVKFNIPRYPPHITVVRNEIPVNLDVWGISREIEFEYCSEIFNDETYWWLRVFSTELEKIRVGLGLDPHSPLIRAPDGENCFHTTIANTKV